MVTAAAIAAASSLVGIGEMEVIFVLIVSPLLILLLCRATFDCSCPTTSTKSQDQKTTN